MIQEETRQSEEHDDKVMGKIFLVGTFLISYPISLWHQYKISKIEREQGPEALKNYLRNWSWHITGAMDERAFKRAKEKYLSS